MALLLVGTVMQAETAYTGRNWWRVLAALALVVSKWPQDAARGYGDQGFHNPNSKSVWGAASECEIRLAEASSKRTSSHKQDCTARERGGHDLLLKAKLVARYGFRGGGDGPGGDDSGEAGDTGEAENQPWLLCREALVNKVQSFLSLRCTLASSLPLSQDPHQKKGV